MNAKDLHDRLKPLQESKGYHFNPDEKMTMALLESLLVNRDRYGYMACPCRLAAGDLDADRDIVCPCAYREADVAEFGACYCGLYVSREWMTTPEAKRETVPERRPPEKALAALGD
ncbi:ferredoxin-thioredoxin reductase catalytic domain-containing protein [Desulfobaculum xiamenense]|nr:ferredoxin-thioredoxin reductase catalytic domain-containing protein [Desulfobaculum xiamenense]